MRTGSDTRTTARLMNERAVLQALYRHGPCTRGAVADLLGFSRPTTNSIVESLASAGLVVEAGQAGGRIGRTAALFTIRWRPRWWWCPGRSSRARAGSP